MASTPPTLRSLARDLLATGALAVALYVVLVYLPGRILPRFTGTEVLLLEAGGVVLVAYLVARALTGAATGVLLRRGEFARGHEVRLFVNLLIAVGAVLALSKLAGVSAESILLGSAFAGIVLGLAAQTVLANVFAGLLLVVADPFRPGDRVGFVSSAYGIFASSYPHEAGYPSYSGTIVDIGLVYTVLALDRGGVAKLPNNVVMSALVIEPRDATQHRVRMTFPLGIPLALVEGALAEVVRALPPPPVGTTSAHLEVADIGATTWDGVFVLWSPNPDPTELRDRLLRAVLGHLPASAPAPRPVP
ncbi:MAG TPA: mechanosensitive ion channel family protein [Thermoplasmata archaeon]|nr:mechanosensitive ion channel family protein [Thermoplasmata archaeon]